MRISISVSVWALLILSAAYYFGAGQLILLVVAAAAVHELGHIAALKLCGGRLTGIRLAATGFIMSGAGIKSYGGEIITAAAGPFASAFLAIMCAFAGRMLELAPAYRLAGMSLVFCVFNLLPVFPLDGGRILYNASARCFGLYAADRIICAVSCTVLFLLLCAGAYILAVTKTNFTLLLAALCLFVCYCKKGKDGVNSVE